MFKQISKIVAVIVAVIGIQAHAGVYIEPYVGYGMGSADGKFSGDYPAPVGTITNGKIDEDLSGTGYGLKLGYSFLLLAFGADYQGGSIEGEGKSALDGEKYTSDYKTTDIGAFVQISLPIFLKVSATYFFSSKMDDDDTVTSGSGMKVGVGFTFLPLVSINVEQVMLNHDETTDSNTTKLDVDASYTFVSLSLPLDF